MKHQTNYSRRTSVRASTLIKTILENKPPRKESKRVRRLAEERMWRKYSISLVFVERELEDACIVDGW